MSTALTVKGQVTIPKQIRLALNLVPGCRVDFMVNDDGEVVIHKVGEAPTAEQPDRFEAVRGKADIKWQTDELMALLRDDADKDSRQAPLTGHMDDDSSDAQPTDLDNPGHVLRGPC
jgi:antitoxin PrlF